MTFREFVVPAADEIIDALGVEPEASEDEATVRTIQLTNGEANLALSYDTVGRSVRCQWHNGTEQLMDLFREGATRMTVESQRGEARIVITFETDSLAGQLHIQVYPEIRVQDHLLFS